MATWTTIPDSSLEPGKPARSVDALALRDNPIAITEGAAGAPRIVNAAITDGTIGSEKLQTGTEERDWVLARTAAASAGAVGTYAMLYRSTAVTVGATYAGSGLSWAGALSGIQSASNQLVVNYGGSGTPSGTWRAMATTSTELGSGTGSGRVEIYPRVGLFLRIS